MSTHPTNLTASGIAMSAALQLFAFGDNRIRVTVDPAGEPWFVAADVCRVLDIASVSLAVNGRADREEGGLDEDEKGVATVNTLGGDQPVIIISESGLYSLIFKSRKPEAKAFKRWVTKEVIPAIRKTGGYAVTAPAVPLTYKEAVKALLVEIEAKEALQLENDTLKPKADFFDAVTASEDTLAMNEAAKLLGHGRNKLMIFLRKSHVLRTNNTPYQEFIDAGYFKVVESKWTDTEGNNHVTLSTRVFQRGIEFIRRQLEKAN